MMRNLAKSWLQCPATMMRRIPEWLERKMRKCAAECKHHLAKQGLLIYCECLAEKLGCGSMWIYLTPAKLILQDQLAGFRIDNIRVVDPKVFVDRNIEAIKHTSF